MIRLCALVLLSAAPALARVGPSHGVTAPSPPLPAGELLMVAVLLAIAAWRWWNRAELPPTDEGPAGLVMALLPGEERRARTVARILTVSSSAPVDDPAQNDEALARWSAERSEPLLAALGQALHRGLLSRRAEADMGPLEGLLRPGAKEALAALAGVREVHRVIAGPAWLEAQTADERWCVVEVGCLALVDETWSGERRQRLRRDRLRLQRPSTSTEVPLAQVLERVDAALSSPRGTLLPADTGGWVIAQLTDAELWPPTHASLRAALARRPARAPRPQADLAERLRGLDARYPAHDTASLHASLRGWAVEVAQARATGQVPPALRDRLAGPAAALPDWWRALHGASPDETHPAGAGAEAEVLLVATAVDPAYELVTARVFPGGSPFDPWGDTAAASPDEERWLLGICLARPAAGWWILDIATLPPYPAPPATR